MDNAKLFNCCTNHAAPDWTLFDALEVNGCIDLHEPDNRGGTCIQGGEPRATAEFFTVYGHMKEGGCEAISDLATLPEAEAVAAYLSGMTGLPVHVCC